MAFFVDIDLQAGRLTGNDHFWSVIRRVGARGRPFTISDVVGETNAHRDSVGDFIRRLTRATPPIAEVVGTREEINPHWTAGRKAEAVTYRLLLSPGETPSLRRDGTEGVYGRRRQNMWNIVRGPQGRSGIEAAMLAALASTTALPIVVSTAKEYLQRLHAAGYLTTDDRAGLAGGGSKPARYRLRPAMNTGPRAPKLLDGTVVYDPNRKTLMGALTGEEEP